MKRKSKSLQSTAYHEAGHAVAAFHLGFRLRDCTIKPAGSSLGMTRRMGRLYLEGIEYRSMTPTLRDRIEREIIQGLAGPVAQRRFAPRSCRHYHASEDYKTAVDTIFRISPSGQEVNAYMQWLKIRAENLVALHWHEIKQVADALMVHETLDGTTIEQVICPGKIVTMAVNQ
jgi:ATP-dependent Zn protease